MNLLELFPFQFSFNQEEETETLKRKCCLDSYIKFYINKLILTTSQRVQKPNIYIHNLNNN